MLTGIFHLKREPYQLICIPQYLILDYIRVAKNNDLILIEIEGIGIFNFYLLYSYFLKVS